MKKAVKEVINGGKIKYSTTESRYNFIKNQKCSVGHVNIIISKMYEDILLSKKEITNYQSN
ncbi:MAG: hypothetical protein EPO37_07610 [Nitrosarchaeum sp.]|nr:MAG: hypothetical protein EPO37_07610 [Nitrosarchaeum sp.]